MQLYAGIDLHASNNFIGIVDEKGKRAFKRKLPNHPGEILLTLGRFQEEMVGVVVESTFNWYWLVDLLGDAGYRVHLANPSAIQKYSGLKHADDQHDAFWLAEMLRLGILRTSRLSPSRSSTERWRTATTNAPC
jgi:transposase